MKIFPEAPTASVASPVFDESVVVEADDGERLHLSLSGQGTPILLLHGWTSSRASWAPLLPALSRRHRVICPDARGHGGHALSATRAPDIRSPRSSMPRKTGSRPSLPRAQCQAQRPARRYG